MSMCSQLAANNTTQIMRVLAALQAGRALTSLDAIREFGTTRLAARIYELRQRGYPIEDEIIEVKTSDNGTARVARYRLKVR